MTSPGSPNSLSSSSSDHHNFPDSFTIGVTEGTPFPCQFCDRAFPRLSYLKRHEQIHSDQMPFRCDYCHRLFKHKRSRDRHVKLHTGDKRYRCAHCESAFSRSDHLKIHMKTHDHLKPFQCNVCNRGYNTAAALTSHMQSHKRMGDRSSVENEKSPPSGPNSVSSSNGAKVNESMSKVTRSPQKDHHPFLSSHPSPHHHRHHLRTLLPTRNTTSFGNNNSCNNSNSNDHQENNESDGEDISDVRVRKESPERKVKSPEKVETETCCGFCGIKCTSLESHIRESHLHHLVFAGLLQNSFWNGSTNWNPFLGQPATGLKGLPKNGHSPSLLALSPPSSPTVPSSRSKLSPQGSHSPIAANEEAGSHAASSCTPYLCNQCSPSPTFADFESFRIHMKTHLALGSTNGHINRPGHLSCPYCGDLISSDYETHIINSHLGTVSTQYGCELCNKSFSKPEELQKHLMELHAVHLYQCSVCREMFDSKVSVQVHFTVKHSNECKRYKCNICGELWNNERDFKVHLRLAHLGSSPSSAPLPLFHPAGAISSPFSASSALHSLFPSPANYFKCKYCPEEFIVAFLLERHVQSHHADRIRPPSPCDGGQPIVVDK